MRREEGEGSDTPTSEERGMAGWEVDVPPTSCADCGAGIVIADSAVFVSSVSEVALMFADSAAWLEPVPVASG